MVQFKEIVHIATQYVSDLYSKYFNTTENILEAEALVIGIDPFDASLYPKLKYIICNCTNTNHITKRDDQEIISLKDEQQYLDSISSTSEHTLFLLLYLLKSSWSRNQKPNHTLKGKNVHIIGYGRVGQQMYRILSNMNAKVTYSDLDTGKDALYEHLKQSDVVTLHTTINCNQSSILGEKELSALKDGAFIVNTSRPEAIDYTELNKHMDRLGGFATDFITPLIHNQKVYTTNHVGGYTYRDLKATSEFCFYKLIRKLNHENN